MAVNRLKAAADLKIPPIYRNDTLAEVKVRVKNLRVDNFSARSDLKARPLTRKAKCSCPPARRGKIAHCRPKRASLIQTAYE
jgi:hypothetical protein